jgi:glutamate synthase (NADPH/NADH) small chain
MDIDLAVIAIGNGTNPLLRTTQGLDFSRRGTLIVDPETLQTSKTGVFAGGDIVTGGATVISAMGAGRQAAVSIHTYLNK